MRSEIRDSFRQSRANRYLSASQGQLQNHIPPTPVAWLGAHGKGFGARHALPKLIERNWLGRRRGRKPEEDRSRQPQMPGLPRDLFGYRVLLVHHAAPPGIEDHPVDAGLPGKLDCHMLPIGAVGDTTGKK
jgi:hypothetical protein